MLALAERGELFFKFRHEWSAGESAAVDYLTNRLIELFAQRRVFLFKIEKRDSYFHTINLTKNFGGIPRHPGFRGHVLGDDATRADNGIFSNGNSAEQRRARAN